ncbi:9507_t:CDS:2, partial [Dentiscutata erythropus]
GQKAQHKRERAKASSQKAASSQLKSRRSALLMTAQKTKLQKLSYVKFVEIPFCAQLMEHAENKHSKKLEECFPGFTELKK